MPVLGSGVLHALPQRPASTRGFSSSMYQHRKQRQSLCVRSASNGAGSKVDEYLPGDMPPSTWHTPAVLLLLLQSFSHYILHPIRWNALEYSTSAGDRRVREVKLTDIRRPLSRTRSNGRLLAISHPSHMSYASCCLFQHRAPPDSSSLG